MVPSQELTLIRQKYLTSGTVRRSDGVHVRVVADQQPDPTAEAMPPTLEDAYLYYVHAPQPQAQVE